MDVYYIGEILSVIIIVYPLRKAPQFYFRELLALSDLRYWTLSNPVPVKADGNRDLKWAWVHRQPYDPDLNSCALAEFSSFGRSISNASTLEVPNTILLGCRSLINPG